MLYQDVRPKKFDDVYGNKAVISALKKFVKMKPKERPHTFLFQGMSGTGKTTVARILAKEFGCGNLDFEELNAANTRGIDMVREITERASLFPLNGECRFFLWDESQQLTSASEQALLKVIEDVPLHSYFVFCTTEPHRIIKTVLNRCTVFQMELLCEKDMANLLEDTLDFLNTNIGDIVFDKIIKISEGCPRQALNYLETVIPLDDENEQLDILKKASIEKDVIDLCRSIVGGKEWKEIANVYNGIKDVEPESIRRIILGYLKKVLLNSGRVDIAAMMECFSDNLFDVGEAGLVLQLFQSINCVRRKSNG